MKDFEELDQELFHAFIIWSYCDWLGDRIKMMEKVIGHYPKIEERLEKFNAEWDKADKLFWESKADQISEGTKP